MLEIEQALQVNSKGTTGFEYVDALLDSEGNFVTSNGTKKFTFSFLNSKSANIDDGVGNFAKKTIDWTFAEKFALDKALEGITNVADIEFMETFDDDENADFKFVKTRFGKNNSNFRSKSIAGKAAFPGKKSNGFVYFNSGLKSWQNDLQVGSRIFSTLFHEVMHALGLEHPHNGVLFPGVKNRDSGSLGKGLRNSGLYTAMSYNRNVLKPANPSGLDIAALQYLYGKNANTNPANDTYFLKDNKNFFETIWDTGGIDTISGKDANKSVRISLRNLILDNETLRRNNYSDFSAVGSFGGFTIAPFPLMENSAGKILQTSGNERLKYVIENAEGSQFGDDIRGNFANNLLQGAGGNDKLYGRRGSDTLIGGTGNDKLNGGSTSSGNEIDILIGGAGNDQFILGNSKGLYYDDKGKGDFAVIEDFQRGDKIRFGSSINSGDITKRNARYKGITGVAYYYNNDLIAFRENNSSANLRANSVAPVSFNLLAADNSDFEELSDTASPVEDFDEIFEFFDLDENDTNAIQVGLRSVLKEVQTDVVEELIGADGNVFLSLVSDQIVDILNQGNSNLNIFNQIGDVFSSGLNFNNNFLPQNIVDTFNQQLDNNGFGDVEISLIEDSGSELIFGLEFSRLFEDNISLDADLTNLGLPDLGISLSGGLDFDFDASAAINFGINVDTNEFFIDTGLGREVDISIGLENSENLSGELGFFTLDAQDPQNIDDEEDPNKAFQASLNFGLDLQDDPNDEDGLLTTDELGESSIEPSLIAEINVNPQLGLTATLPGLPSLTADLDFNAQYNFLTNQFVAPQQVVTNDNNLSPTFGLNNIELDLSSLSFINQFAEPVNRFITPITEKLSFLTESIPLLSDIPIDDVKKAVNDKLNQDGKPGISLLDLIQFVAEIKGVEIDTRLLADGIDLGNTIGEISNSLKNGGKLALGSVEFNEGVINRDNLNNSPVTVEVGNETGLNIPILENPGDVALDLLLGNNIDLITYTAPEFKLNGTIGETIPVLGPLGIFVGGNFDLSTNLAFGLDTSGLQEGNIKDNVFVIDGNEPEIQAGVTPVFGPGLQIGIGSAQIYQGIGGEINLDFKDSDNNGKVRFSEFKGFDVEPELGYTFGGSINIGPVALFKKESNTSIQPEAIAGEVNKIWGYIEDVYDATGGLLGRVLEPLKELDPFNSDSAAAQLGRDLDVFNKNGKLREGLRNADILNKDSALRKGIEKIGGPGVREAFRELDKAFETLGSEAEALRENFTLENFQNLGSQVIKDAQAKVAKIEAEAQKAQEKAAEAVDKVVEEGGEVCDKVLFGTCEQLGKSNPFKKGGIFGLTSNNSLFNELNKTIKDIEELPSGNGLNLASSDFDDISALGNAVADAVEATKTNFSNVFSDTLLTNLLLEGTSSDDELYSGSGNDTLRGLGGNDNLLSGSGDDFLDGGNGDDFLNGGDGKDFLDSGDGNDILFGGKGDDNIIARNGTNLIYGEQGNDNIIVSILTKDGVTPTTGKGEVYGGEGNDNLTGGNKEDTLYGENGEDKIFGRGGNDSLFGGSGNDNLNGDSGFDVLFGGKDNDILAGGSENDYLDGGAGDDTLYGFAADEPDNLSAEVAGNNRLIGNSGNDSLVGSAGNDYLDGGDDGDVLEGGNGADSLYGGAGNDRLDGGEDRNGDFLSGGAGNDFLNGGDGSDTLEGGDGNDNIIGGTLGINNSVARDILRGGAGNDTLTAASGDDRSSTLEGGADADLLIGNFGSDVLRGGSGVDFLVGRGGKDTLEGGSDDDKYTLGVKTNSIPANAGSLIIDSQGTDTIEFKDFFSKDADIDLSLQLMGNGYTGLWFKENSLVVDFNQNGVVDKEEDIFIENFFDLGLNPGAGAIETIKDAKVTITSDEILNLFATEVENFAPSLNTNLANHLTFLPQNKINSTGDVVRDIIAAGAIFDRDDGNINSIALTGVDNSNGAWQYSLDDGNSWQSIEELSDNNALLLEETNKVRFVPNQGFIGSANFTFRAWDKTQGIAGDFTDVRNNGDITAYSSNTSKADIAVGFDGWTRKLDNLNSTNQSVAFSKGFGQEDLYLVGNQYLTADNQSISIEKYGENGDLIWSEVLDTPNFEQVNDNAVDINSNVYLTGSTLGSFDGINQGTSGDAWLAKYNPEGDLSWVQQLGTAETDDAYGIDTDVNGNAYISGRTFGKLGDLSFGNYDAWLAKYDPEGNLLWTKQEGTANSDEYNGLAVDSLDNIYTFGVFNRNFTNRTEDLLVAKYSPEGFLSWTQQFGTPETDTITATDTLSNTHVYFAGGTYGNLAGDNLGDSDAWISKYDSNGNLVWSKQFGTEAYEQADAIVVDTLGNAYVAGTTKGNLGGENAGGFDAWVNKFDPDGNLLWSKQFGTPSSDKFQDITLDKLTRDIYLSGTTDFKGWLLKLEESTAQVTFQNDELAEDDSSNFVGDASNENIQIAIANVAQEETNGQLTFSVALSEASTETIAINYSTEDGKAIAGKDYIAANGTLEFAPGETEKTITVEVLSDNQFEASEGFTIDLSNANGVAIVNTQATGIITNNKVDVLEVNNNNNLTGSLSSTDDTYIYQDETYYYDFFALPIDSEINAGDIVTVTLASEAFDPVLMILDSEGNVIDYNDNAAEGSTSSELTFIAGADNSFFISVEAKEANQTGDYSLAIDTVDVADADFASDSLKVINAIAPTDNLTGSLTDSDRRSPVAITNDDGSSETFDVFTDDYLLTNTEVGQQVEVSLSSNTFNGVLDIFQIDAAGDKISLVSEPNLVAGIGTTETVVLTIQADTNYLISVTGGTEAVDAVKFGEYSLFTELI